MSNRRRLRRHDSDVIKVNPWNCIGGIIRGELSEDARRLAAAALIAVGFAPRDYTAEKVMSSLRELYAAGFLDVGADGKAFLSRPLTGPLGTMTGRVPLTKDDCRDLVSAELEDLWDRSP
jgi:hypothetical protein